ncbi:hypothetical protein HIM_07751 [Hirsutella minnesotensis 3608]|uniref:Uncharacterized protein n=1 Tax=Hirsutella minnesotensis 3608 TaxID=1043627 RepID=A0A0F7ZYP0_9HYPO|nr:hypothetical protein HIM_07751 [Hirsutella minnesotensis 3608]
MTGADGRPPVASRAIGVLRVESGSSRSRGPRRDGYLRRVGGQVRAVVPACSPRWSQRRDSDHACGHEERLKLANGLHGLQQPVRGLHHVGGPQHLQGQAGAAVPTRLPGYMM